RYGLGLVEHQFVGFHADPELPAQHLEAQAALAQRGPERVPGSICAKVRAVSSRCCCTVCRISGGRERWTRTSSLGSAAGLPRCKTCHARTPPASPNKEFPIVHRRW